MLGLIGLLLGVAVKRLGLLCVGTLLLAGCAGGAPDAAPSAPSEAPSTPAGPVVTGPGTYAYEAGGASVEVTLPGVADTTVAGVVALAKAPKPVYVSVVVDNRKGAAAVMPSEVAAYTVSGSKVTYEAAYKYLDTLDDSKMSVEDGNKVIAAYNKVNDPVSVGETRTVTMVGTKPLPKDIVRVTVADAYGDETEATKR
jgi:hypothetical protein